jgi:hypothetical protein
MQSSVVEEIDYVVDKEVLNFEHRWKLKKWIDQKKLEVEGLQTNPSSIYLWENNFDKINSCFYCNVYGSYLIEKHIKLKNETNRPHYFLSHNPNMIHFLEKNIQLIDWTALSSNTVAIHLLEHNQDKIHWRVLSGNPAAIHLLEKNPDKIDWELLSRNTHPTAINWLEQNIEKVSWWYLSSNPAAIHLLEQNINKICWETLCRNPAALHIIQQNLHKIEGDILAWNILSGEEWAISILENNLDKVNWGSLSRNPAAIHILEQNPDKIHWHYFSGNPAIFELDYDFFHRRMMIINEELMIKTWHPSRFKEWCLSIDEIDELT